MSETRQGTMKVSVQESNGITLTKEYGFTVKDEQRGMSFDYFDHPEYGKVLLINQDVFFLKFWKTEDVQSLQRLVNMATGAELEMRSAQ